MQRIPITATDVYEAVRQNAIYVKEGTRPLMKLESRELPKDINLRAANLRGASFAGSKLEGADFSRADLTDANFENAILTRAKLDKANCRGARFNGACLRNAELKACRDLSAAQLAGSDLTGSTLPENISSFETLKTVQESASQAKTLFLSMLAACAYTCLTAFSTRDLALISNSTTSPLPVIRTSIPIAAFYFLAPVVLTLLFVYFHLSLQRLWELFADLPAIFPDGVPLDKRAYPWLLSGLVRSRLTLLRTQKPPLTVLQSIISMLLAYGTVPITLAVCWMRYLPDHDWRGSLVNVGLLILCVALGLCFRSYATATLTHAPTVIPINIWVWSAFALVALGSGISKPSAHFVGIGVCLGVAILAGALCDLKWKPHLFMHSVSLNEVFGPLARNGTSLVILLGALGVATFGSIEGVNLDASAAGTAWMPGYKPQDPRIAVPWLWSRIGYSSSTHITVADAAKPGLHLDDKDLRFAIVGGASLEGVIFDNSNLSYASFRSAKLKNASFRGATLYAASFENADLTGVDLTGANIIGASFVRCTGLTETQRRAAKYWQFSTLDQMHDLKYKRFHGNDRLLKGANLDGADLSQISMYGVDLRLASLRGANLQGVNLDHVKVFKTDFRGTRLESRQLDSVIGLRLGLYDHLLARVLGLNSSYFEVDFGRYNLSNADLSEMDLSELDFRGADLQAANLRTVTVHTDHRLSNHANLG